MNLFGGIRNCVFLMLEFYSIGMELRYFRSHFSIYFKSILNIIYYFYFYKT